MAGFGVRLLGGYTATLIVTNDCGQDIDTQLIAVGGPPEASFTATPTSGCAPLDVDFTDTSTGSPTSYAWNFGDGATSTSPNPSHTYTTAGSYTVTLTVSNACGSDDASTLISVSPANRPPVLDPVGNQAVDEAQVLSVPLSAADPDGDDMAFSVVGFAHLLHIDRQRRRDSHARRLPRLYLRRRLSGHRNKSHRQRYTRQNRL